MNLAEECWLRRPFPGNAEATQKYYTAIGAITGVEPEVRDTLDKFKARNGFAPGAGGDVQAIYFNEGDLRLGRDMHCRQNGLNVACYVSNYGEPPFVAGGANPKWPNAQDALAQAIAGPSGGHPPFATVAMEYSPTPTSKVVTVREMDGKTANRFPRSDCTFGVGSIIDPRKGIPGVDVDTGIDIEPGDIVTFSAGGSIWAGVCHTGDSDANGHPNPGSMYPLPSAPGYGLIGRVGNRPYFNIGLRREVRFLGEDGGQPASGGRLFLRTNDDVPGNGYGSFSVSVVVDRQNVKFYVYDNANVLDDDPALDTEGFKFAPQMCMTCHGGKFQTNRVKDAAFLPFDLSNFIFSSNPAFTRLAQEENVRKLNALVKLANPNPGSAVAEMIDWMYIQTNANIPASVNIPGTAARDTAVTTVPGWSGSAEHAALYQSFVKPYCRSCHVATRAGSGLEFNSYTQLQAYGGPLGRLDSILCGTAEMPQAQVPHLKLKQELFDDVVAKELRALGVTCVTKATRPSLTPPGAELEFSGLCARFPEFPPCRR